LFAVGFKNHWSIKESIKDIEVENRILEQLLMIFWKTDTKTSKSVGTPFSGS